MVEKAKPLQEVFGSLERICAFVRRTRLLLVSKGHAKCVKSSRVAHDERFGEEMGKLLDVCFDLFHATSQLSFLVHESYQDSPRARGIFQELWKASDKHEHGMVWYGMAWYGMAWYGMVWHGMA